MYISSLVKNNMHKMIPPSSSFSNLFLSLTPPLPHLILSLESALCWASASRAWNSRELVVKSRHVRKALLTYGGVKLDNL